MSVADRTSCAALCGRSAQSIRVTIPDMSDALVERLGALYAHPTISSAEAAAIVLEAVRQEVMRLRHRLAIEGELSI